MRLDGWIVNRTAGDRSSLRLLRRVGQVDPASLDSYRAAGGYEMLRRAVAAGVKVSSRLVIAFRTGV